jgi:short subunit dehydrogenase
VTIGGKTIFIAGLTSGISATSTRCIAELGTYDRWRARPISGSRERLWKPISGRMERHQHIDGVFWSRIMGVNVKGTFLTLKHTLPIIEWQGKGVIVITTSVAAGPH